MLLRRGDIESNLYKLIENNPDPNPPPPPAPALALTRYKLMDYWVDGGYSDDMQVHSSSYTYRCRCRCRCRCMSREINPIVGSYYSNYHAHT